LKDNVKLFGSTINSNHLNTSKEEDPSMLGAHVQSYIFSMNITTLDYLIHHGIFSNTKYVETFLEAITLKEILMSRLIIANGWNIGSFLKIYHGVDFTFRDKTASDYNQEFYGDIMVEWGRQSLWDKYDLVFIKGNRGIDLDK
jgi:hypothetical protein